MTRTYTYYRETVQYRRPVNINGEIEYEYDGGDGYDFDYTPDSKDLREALVEVVINYYFGEQIRKNPSCEKNYKYLVEQLVDGDYCEDVLLDSFEEELKDYFEDEAQESERNY